MVLATDSRRAAGRLLAREVRVGVEVEAGEEGDWGEKLSQMGRHVVAKSPKDPASALSRYARKLGVMEVKRDREGARISLGVTFERLCALEDRSCTDRSARNEKRVHR